MTKLAKCDLLLGLNRFYAGEKERLNENGLVMTLEDDRIYDEIKDIINKYFKEND